MLRKRIGTAALTASVLTAASGCAWFEGEEEHLDFAAYDGRLTEMYNESIRLTTELDAAEARIVQDCLETQGFTLHDQARFENMVPAERESFLGEPEYAAFLPTVEDAERRGFWQWAALDGAQEAEPELYAEWLIEQEAFLAATLSPEFAAQALEVLSGEATELDEFYLQDPEDQYAWYVAYAGEPWAADNHPELAGDSADPSGGDAYGGPPPEGCLLEMIEAVYGELEPVENEEEGFTDWISRPEPPTGDGQGLHERYVVRTADAEADLLDCLDERGSTGWEFQNGRILVREYLVASGETVNPADIGTPTTGAWPEIPAEAPDVTDVEGWLGFERELAVDFAECGDESGYRAAAAEAWEQAQLRYYLDIEEETYAWQDGMRGYLEAAQEVIGE
ncbi:hypothetical protein [Glycomyces sp. YM15]|uniref:hypothetical protein n=1 Tax=Glycomyces sp. YM15 TaxID=2800446 RepID=UPI001962ECCE|nr:hypothetical protein [Glycomyces sp. YM15]